MPQTSKRWQKFNNERQIEVSPRKANLNGQWQRRVLNKRGDYQDASAAEKRDRKKTIARTNKQPDCTKSTQGAV